MVDKFAIIQVGIYYKTTWSECCILEKLPWTIWVVQDWDGAILGTGNTVALREYNTHGDEAFILKKRKCAVALAGMCVMISSMAILKGAICFKGSVKSSGTIRTCSNESCHYHSEFRMIKLNGNK